MSHLFETEAIGNFGNVPIGFLQKDFRFLNDPAANDVSRGAPGIILQYLIEIIHVDG